jgi:hypothetical protein
MNDCPKKPLISDDVEYSPEVIKACKYWRDNIHPFKTNSPQEALKKCEWLLPHIFKTFNKPIPTLSFIEAAHSNGAYYPFDNTITFYGKVSIITFFHEIAHAIYGSNEKTAVLWSVNLFRRIFPLSYSRLIADGHCLVKKQ